MDSIQREKKKSPGKRKVRRGSGISCEETRGEPPLLFEEQRNDRRPRVGKIPMRSAASIRYKGNQVARAYLHGRGVAVDEFKAELHCGLDNEVVVFGHAELVGSGLGHGFCHIALIRLPGETPRSSEPGTSILKKRAEMVGAVGIEPTTSPV
jgi:hypothetical protein